MEAQSLRRDLTCNQCGKKFQRKAHLLRHQQQHSGDRPYSCQFCAKTFKRSDVLRDHFSRCERRGESEIPSSLERGRKRHACDECSRLKVKCDNNIPCRKCKEFGRTCVKSYSTVASSPETTNSAGSATTPDLTGSDRNSIGFLLNCPGDTDFMREFPKDSTLSPNGKAAEPDFTNTLPLRDDYEPMVGGMASATRLPAYNAYEHVQMEANLDNFLSNLEFETFNQQTNVLPTSGDNMMAWAGQDTRYLDRALLDRRVFDIREKLKYTAMTMNPPHAAPKEVLEAIEFITANKIAHWIRLYFRHWHKHGPMVHEATFNPCTAALPLVLALLSIGAMYSEKTDVDKVKLLLDTVEAYVYSVPKLSEEYDLPDRLYIRHSENAPMEWQRFQLEELQGAYLMVVLQYWTGNHVARTRVRQQRFGRVIAIIHHLELQRVQHPPNPVINSQQTFLAWIFRESCIRTATIAVMLDNAMGIFNNVAPRFQWTEIDLTFPSADIYFNTASYDELLATRRFPVPRMKIKDAFLTLFSAPEMGNEHLKMLRERDLNPLDMQMLIHFLYTHAWAALFENPLISLPRSPSQIPIILAPWKTALMSWKTIWDEIRSSAPPSEWEKLGFQVTAETYYDAISSILDVWERKGGRFELLAGDCEKGMHLRRLLSL